jgi:hypothetical protein
VTQGQIPQERNRPTHFLLSMNFPKNYLNNISLIWVIWCYLHLPTLQCTGHVVRDPTVELRRMNTPLCPHLKWSYAYYYRSAHVF